MTSWLADLASVVLEAQRRGFVGDAPVDVAIEHARGFAAGVDAPPSRFADLGSGGGLPGLVLVELWPSAEAVLVDANQKRCAFLREAVGTLSLDGRVEVVEGRAEALGRQSGLRGGFDVVTARGFGRPAVTAECAAPFLRVGGWLVVSEPPAAPDSPDSPDSEDRWPAEGLALCGMAPERSWATPFRFQALRQVEACPERYPRRVGVPAKRPLF
jgi:16S rRNA (guanine527-N7)-methyltransferase